MIPSFTTIPTDHPRALDARDVGQDEKVSKPRDGFGEAYNHLAKKKAETDRPDQKTVPAEAESDAIASNDDVLTDAQEADDAQVKQAEEAQPGEVLTMPIAEADVLLQAEPIAEIASLPLAASLSEEGTTRDPVNDLPEQSKVVQTIVSEGVEQVPRPPGTATTVPPGVATTPAIETPVAAKPLAAESANPAGDLSDADALLTGSAQTDARSPTPSIEQPLMEVKPVSKQASAQVLKTAASIAALSAAAAPVEQDVENLEVELTEGAAADLFDGPTDVRLLGRSVVEGAPAPQLIWQSAAQASVLLRTEGDSKFLNAVRHEGNTEDVEGLEAVISTQETAINNVLRSSPNAVATRVDASAVMSQLSAAVQRNGAGQLEVALNPPELGRVRFAMESQDGNMVIAITADKPETMELIRRHIDQLEKEFLELGYDSLSFNFSPPDDRSGDSTGEERGAGFSGASISDEMSPVPTHSSPGNGINSLVSNGQIDIRL